ncbi:FLU1 [Auxenochlorella protothecoides x Auxenochlorella symbiontica]|uniref:Uncharacterized protein n=1 Tax=Auxenochlorella protothecoides TaxID=3075 RepID=A0A1D2A417_AUXPR
MRSVCDCRCQVRAPAQGREQACTPVSRHAGGAATHIRPIGRSPGLASFLTGAVAAGILAVAPPSQAVAPFLQSQGGQGPLVEEEARLFRMREQYEGEAAESLAKARSALEEETRTQQRSSSLLCATPFGVDVVGITEAVAITGALVGGVSARRRKLELEKLNERLRTINQQLRQQARAGVMYAPGLTYAPPAGGRTDNGAGAAQGAVALPGASNLTLVPPMPVPMPGTAEGADPPGDWGGVSGGGGSPALGGMGLSVLSMDDEEGPSPESVHCQQALKEGKRLLKNGSAGAAMVRFEKAHMLARSLGDRVKERRAVRGLAAASRLAGQPRQAVKHLLRVLEISRDMGDFVGDADAYGTIADIYTDIGEFEHAAEYYDKYIARMDNTGSPV